MDYSRKGNYNLKCWSLEVNYYFFCLMMSTDLIEGSDRCGWITETHTHLSHMHNSWLEHQSLYLETYNNSRGVQCCCSSLGPRSLCSAPFRGLIHSFRLALVHQATVSEIQLGACVSEIKEKSLLLWKGMKLKVDWQKINWRLFQFGFSLILFQVERPNIPIPASKKCALTFSICRIWRENWIFELWAIK